jgi:glucose dehydrogenase
MNWYFQYTPGDLWDYDEVGTHILIDDDVAGQPRKLITHSARNGHLYTMDRHNGQIIGAKPRLLHRKSQVGCTSDDAASNGLRWRIRASPG